MGKQGIALKHHADPAVFRGDVVHLSAIDADRAAFRLIKPGNQAKSCAFATTTWSQQRDAFTIANVEIEIVENRSAAKFFGDRFEAECHPLIAPLVSPLTIWRWNNNTSNKSGIAPITVAAA